MMLPNTFTLVLLALQATTALSQETRSSKRGLIYTVGKHSKAADQRIWASNGSELTWYYTYGPAPLAIYSSLEFVPMLFSIPSPDDTAFTDTVTSQLEAGANITHLLAFNEPDGPTSQGGTNLAASNAAAAYIAEYLPLQAKFPHLKLGLPAITGSQRGINWLAEFNASCQALNGDAGCPADFIPLHWYGDFQGLASWIGQIRAAYRTMPIWITEFADPNSSLKVTQSNFNETLEYLDRLDYVERYAYFGGFRSQDSNVGSNVAMLDRGGSLTDIGAWYLGENVAGKRPSSEAVRTSGLGQRAWVLAVALAVLLFA